MNTEQSFNFAPKQFGKEPDRLDIKKWRHVKLQVLFGFLLLIILIIVIGIITIQQVTMLGNLTSTIHKHPLKVSNAALRASLGAAKMHRSMKGIVLADTDISRDKAINAMNSEEKIIYYNLDIVRDLILGDEGRELEKKSRLILDEWKPIQEQVIMLALTDRRDEAARIATGEGAAHEKALEESLLALTSYAKTKASYFMARYNKIQQNAKRFVLFSIVFVILLSCGIALITLNRLYYAIKRYRKTQEENERLIIELQQALSEIKKLSGFLPICASCKKIRDDRGYWNQIETYIKDHSEAQFSHSICPECAEKLYPELIRRKTNNE